MPATNPDSDADRRRTRRQCFVLLTPARRLAHVTVDVPHPNALTLRVLGRSAHTVPTLLAHLDTVPTLLSLTRRPGAAARLLGQTVLLLYDITLDGNGYRWHLAAPARSRWGIVGRDHA